MKELKDKKLNYIIEKNILFIDEFLDENLCSMTQAQYEKLKNIKIKVKKLKNDPNYNFEIIVENFSAYCL